MEIETARLRAALDRLHRVVPSRTTIPILGNIAIEPDDGGCRLTANNLDMCASEVIPCATLERPQPITAPGRMLADLVRKCAGSNISLTVDDKASHLRIRHGRATWTLQALPVSDFPRFDAAAPTCSFELPGDVLVAMIESVAFAVSKEETRYYLNGAHVHVMAGQLRMVATDGHRLSLIHVPCPDGAAGMPGIIIPTAALEELSRLGKAAGSGPVRIGLTDTRIEASHGTSHLASKLIDGTFPDYMRVIPEPGPVSVGVDRQALEDAADRAMTLATERGRALRLELGESAALTVSVTNADYGSARDQVPAEIDNPSGPSGMDAIGVNGRYLRDNLAAIPGARVLLRMRDPGSPIHITDPDRKDRVYVLMPMRV